MSQRIRVLVLALVASLALGTVACADLAGPSGAACSGHQGSETCD